MWRRCGNSDASDERIDLTFAKALVAQRVIVHGTARAPSHDVIGVATHGMHDLHDLHGRSGQGDAVCMLLAARWGIPSDGRGRGLGGGPEVGPGATLSEAGLHTYANPFLLHSFLIREYSD